MICSGSKEKIPGHTSLKYYQLLRQEGNWNNERERVKTLVEYMQEATPRRTGEREHCEKRKDEIGVFTDRTQKLSFSRLIGVVAQNQPESSSPHFWINRVGTIAHYYQYYLT